MSEGAQLDNPSEVRKHLERLTEHERCEEAIISLASRPQSPQFALKADQT